MSSYCYNCMYPIEAEAAVCPHCGQAPFGDNPNHQLKPGTLLKNRYLIGNSLGQGGFGITYIGRDTLLNIRLAIKEYYPNGCAYRDNTITDDVINTASGQDFFQNGKMKFLHEAQILARFTEEPSIVSVYDFFEENNTAYIVMEFLDGITLKRFTAMNGKIPAASLVRVMLPLICTLGKVHEQGIIHRDISPDNIMVLRDGTLKLLDFGAAREVSGDKSLSVMLKPGYAPEEQYRRKGKQGPWTDVYALCGTMYYCLTGERPEESVERMMSDSLQRPSALGALITPAQESVLLHGMAVQANERYQSMEELAAALSGETLPPRDGTQKRPIDNPLQTDIVANPEPNVNVRNTTNAQGHTKRKNIEHRKKTRTLPLTVAVLFLAALFVFGGFRLLDEVRKQNVPTDALSQEQAIADNWFASHSERSPSPEEIFDSEANAAFTSGEQVDTQNSNVVSGTSDESSSVKTTITPFDSDTVAPAPNPNGFGTTYDPADITALVQRAAILLNGQEVTFNPSADFVPDEPIRYYLDDTILVIAWKEYIEERCCTFAEVKISNGSQLRRKLTEDSYGSSAQLYASELANSSNAVVAINGDLYTFRDMGITVFQRKLYRNNPAQIDSCFFTATGDMLFSRAGELMGEGEAERFIQENEVVFSLAFGPVLVDNGELQHCSSYPVGEIDFEYSRSCIAMTDDLHYLLMTINHTTDARPRATINELARIIYSKNVWKAYTLDGGQTAEIVMMGGPINRVDFGEERKVSDIIYFATAIPEEVHS